MTGNGEAIEMNRKAVSGIMLSLLLIGMLTLAFSVQKVNAAGWIYIRADGSVDPVTAPIQRDGNVYTFTDNIYDHFVVERDDVVVDGADHTLYGSITLEGRNNVTIKNMEVRVGGHVLGVIGSSHINIIRNKFISCPTADGVITLVGSSYNTIYGNNITDSGDAIEVGSSNNNIIYGNNITNNNFGIAVRHSYNNTIFGNHIAGNYIGIIFDASLNNIFYHNNFIDNQNQVYATGGNLWDNGYPSGGNYWSDQYHGDCADHYKGQGQDVPGSDGIVDTPYDQDRYPLMEPWTPEVKPYANYAKLAETRAEAYAAYADIVFYYSAYNPEYYDSSILVQALEGLIPVLIDLGELSVVEIAEDVASQIMKSVDMIESFKDWLDGLQEPIEQIAEWIGPASAHAALTYGCLIELENLCEQEADAWKSEDLNGVRSVLEEEETKVSNALVWARGFKYYASSLEDDTAFEVADSTVDFLSRDAKQIIHLMRVARGQKLVQVELGSFADLHLYDSEELHDGPIYDEQGEVIDIEENIPNSYYIGPETEPQFVAIFSPLIATYIIQVVGRGSSNPSNFMLTTTLYDETGTILSSSSCLDTIVSGQTQTFTTEVSETGLELYVWQYVFKDIKRGTELRINTEDEHFQFIAPDKEFSMKEACEMVVRKHSIFIWHKDEEIKLVTNAVDTRIDFCFAYATDMETGEKYLLIGKPGIE